VITAAYCLWTLQRVFLGKTNETWAAMPDLSPRETFSLLPLAALAVAFGVYPHPILNLMRATVGYLNALVAGS